MRVQNKPKVFVITPFGDDFMSLYNELKNHFDENFEFTNAGDLGNQQNVLQDIVEGIYQACIVIADLSGLNANVFYELGLAHAMNKKVIIITQDIGELPFDIKSYRANEYSLHFNKLPKLIKDLEKLLNGAVNNSVKYGNPVSDYIPNFYKEESTMMSDVEYDSVVTNSENEESDADKESDKGFLDYIAEIEENSNKMTDEINAISQEMNDMNESITDAISDINRVKSQNGKTDAAFVRNICRKLSIPLECFAGKLKGHVSEMSNYWDVVENDYLSLLDNKYTRKSDNIQSLRMSMEALNGMQAAIDNSNVEIEQFITVMRGSIGMERKLSRAISMLISELEAYLSVTEKMSSSVDRILSKGEIIIGDLVKN